MGLNFIAFRSGGIGRIFRNATLVTASSLFLAAASAIALAFNARALGAANYGVLATIQAFVALISTLTTFESWQPVVRLGSRPRADLKVIIACGVLLDALAALAATLLAVVLVFIGGRLTGLAPDARLLAALYSLSLLGGLAGTPKGYFRLKGRYDVLVGNQVAQGVALVVVSALLWFFKAPLIAYIVSLAAVAGFYNASLLVRLVLHARRSGGSKRLQGRRVRRFFPFFARAALGTGLLTTLVGSRRNISQLLVAALLGGAAPGVYAIAARLASMVTRLSGPLNQVLFPEVVRLASGAPSDRLARAMARMTLLSLTASAAIVAAAALFRGELVTLVAGRGFRGAEVVFVLLLTAECLELGGIHFNPFIQARRGTRPLLAIGIGSMFVLIAGAVALVRPFGLPGVAMAAVAAAALIYVSMMGLTFGLLSRSRGGQLTVGA